MRLTHAGAKQSSDAAAREQLEKVVEVLVTGERSFASICQCLAEKNSALPLFWGCRCFGVLTYPCRLLAERCGSFEECVAWARRKFQQQFYDRIAQVRALWH